FASCADRVRIVCRHAPHHVPTRSASCADRIRIMRRQAPLVVRERTALSTGKDGSFREKEPSFLSVETVRGYRTGLSWNRKS
ncbi:MAG: hypothetical protein K2K03_09035, partial [Prevotella sp.]|nr:hypothetical protein [Prevotella sp.]